MQKDTNFFFQNADPLPGVVGPLSGSHIFKRRSGGTGRALWWAFSPTAQSSYNTDTCHLPSQSCSMKNLSSSIGASLQKPTRADLSSWSKGGYNCNCWKCFSRRIFSAPHSAKMCWEDISPSLHKVQVGPFPSRLLAVSIICWCLFM